MENLSYDELITIVIALDNEACNRHSAEAQELRRLKWKVFALAAEKRPPMAVNAQAKGIIAQEAR